LELLPYARDREVALAESRIGAESVLAIAVSIKAPACATLWHP